VRLEIPPEQLSVIVFLPLVANPIVKDYTYHSRAVKESDDEGKREGNKEA
jgi:hypothetical protein